MRLRACLCGSPSTQGDDPASTHCKEFQTRTLIRNCPVLIFDDSLSAVDTETDAAIRKALKERSAKATTLIISHRINTLAEADKIVVLEGGRITQIGAHADLVKQPGLYQRVWEIQNSLEEEFEERREAN